MTRYLGRSAGACVLAIGLLGGASAYAHDPPEVSRIVWSASASADGADATSAVFQTERGFIVGDTQTRSYRWVCTEALEVELGEHPGFVLLPNDVWMVSTEHGLLTSSDKGCHWNPVERFGTRVASALAQASDDPKHVFVTIAGAADGGLFESRDAGATWQKRLNLAPDDFVTQIAIAASDPARIYLNGLVIDEQSGNFSFQLTLSHDGGTTWKRAYVPLGTDEDHAVLAAVSPLDPDRVVVLARNRRWGEAPDRALYSSDAGASYREISRGPKLTAATFSPDGQAILVAGGESLSRIEVNAEEGAEAQPIGMSQMLSCAQPGPQGLYACGHVNIYDPVVYGASISSDEGETWESLMSFTEVKEQIACTNEHVAQQCKDQWIDWQLEILVGLGGADIDSVEGWRDFRGIEEVPHPAPAHTLSTARRTTPSGAAASDGEGAAGSSSDGAQNPNADQSSAKAEKQPSSSGCQGVPEGPSNGVVWGVLGVLGLWIQRRSRTRVTVTS